MASLYLLPTSHFKGTVVKAPKFKYQSKHVCKFDTPKQIKVIIASKKSKMAIDTLKQHACSCGKTITYDLEREIIS
jgi:hypothetical protein